VGPLNGRWSYVSEFTALLQGFSELYDRGHILTEATEAEQIVYADIGNENVRGPDFSLINLLPDPQVLLDARSGIPVTTQRRFDVYKDIAEGAAEGA